MAEEHLTTPGVNNTPFFQEETEERGGAAVERMILGSDKVALTPLPTQGDLYNDAHARNLGTEPPGTWYVDPQGMRDSLIALKPATFTNTFVNYNFPNTSAGREQANAKIIYTIETYEVAPAVLVAGGGRQWVAVVGYRTDSAGSLVSMFLNDPRPPLPVGTSDPPDFEVSAANWNTNTYYLQAVSGGTQWNNQFAMVCDPDKPKGELRAAVEKPRADGRQIIKAEQAVALAKDLLAERGSLERELFARAIKQGKPAKPQLVQVLDKKDQFYYLVRWQIDGQDAALVAIDARFGVFHEAIAFHKPLISFRVSPAEIPRLLERRFVEEERIEDVRDRIVHRLIQRLDPRQPGLAGWELQPLRDMLEVELARSRQPAHSFEVRPEEINVHSMMVWQPAAQSMSMLYPFYLVNTPQRPYYVRAIDAAVFTRFDPLFRQRLGG